MSRFKRSLVGVVIFCMCLVLNCSLSAEELPKPLSETNKSGQRFITIDFDNVDIQLFIKYISELTGKNFVVDKAVQGNVTILSPTKISEIEAYRCLNQCWRYMVLPLLSLVQSLKYCHLPGPDRKTYRC